MKNKYCRNLINTPLIAFALATGVASAGTTETMTPAPVAPATEDVVSGVLKLDINTHFVSYGADVWSDDNPSISELNFNPMLELAFDLPGEFTATLGAWADVTDKNTSGSIGGNLMEVDVWAGLAYTYEKFTVGVTAQDWLYGSASEEIVDVNLSYACFLSPKLTIHNRVGAGAAGVAGGDEGTILVLGVSHSVEAGPVTFSFPVNVAYFATDGFHAPTADTGFGYASVGVGASLPLEAIAAFGDWTLNGGLTYYFTDDDVIPGNDHGDFLTATVGVSLAF